jgi:hypothetical protein
MPYIVLDESTAQAAPAVTIGAPLTSVGMTLLDFINELAPEIGNRTDVTMANARMKLWINWAYRNVASMLTIKELFGSFALATVDTQPFYAMPFSVAWIKRLALIDSTNFLMGGRQMEMIDEPDYRLLGDFDGEPTKYFRFRRMLVLYGTPDGIYNLAVDCRVRPSDLVANTDSPLLPEEFHESILLYSRYRAFRSLRLYNEASVALNDALTVMRPLLNTDSEEMDGAIQQVQPVQSKRQLFQGRN